MSCDYYLSSPYAEHDVIISISHERYVDLINARQVLADALAFEELFEVVLENYKDLEMFCVARSLESSTGSHKEIEAASKSISEANRLVINFFTSVRSYTEQVKGFFKTAANGATFKLVAKRKLDGLTLVSDGDVCKNYALLYELRNFSQHCALPVQGLAPREGRSFAWSEMIYPFARANLFKEYLVGRKSVEACAAKSAISEGVDRIDLRVICYESLRSISAFHCCQRNMIYSDCKNARAIISSAIDEVRAEISSKNHFTTTIKHFAKVSCSSFGQGGVGDSVYLMLDWDDVRKAMQYRNRMQIGDFKALK